MHGQAPCFAARRQGRASVWAGGALRPALIVVLLASLALAACAGKKPQPEELPPPGPPVAMRESPEIFVANLAPRNQDLTSWKDMAPTVRKSLRYVNSKPQDAVAVKRPGLTVTWGELSRSLTRLRELLPRLDAEPGLLLANFRWVEVPGGISYSGYYEPQVGPAARASRAIPRPSTACRRISGVCAPGAAAIMTGVPSRKNRCWPIGAWNWPGPRTLWMSFFWKFRVRAA